MIRLVAAKQPIVSTIAIESVRAPVVTTQGVIAVAAIQQHRLGDQSGPIPSAAIAKLHGIELIARPDEEALNLGPLARILDDEGQIAIPLLQPNLVRSQAVESQGIDLARSTVVHPHRVVAVSTAEDVGVVAGTAGQRVVALTTIEQVVAVTAFKPVIPGQPQHHVIPPVAIYLVRARASRRKIIPWPAEPVPAMCQPHFGEGRHDLLTRLRIVGPVAQPVQACPSGQLSAREAVQVHQVHHRRLGVAGLERVKPCRHRLVIQRDAGVVDLQFDAVEIGLEPGLQCDGAVDRIPQQLVRLIEQRLARAVEIDRQRRFHGRHGQKRLAVEALQNRELVQPRLIRRAASADSFKTQAEIDAGKGAGGCRGHGGGVRPGLDQTVEPGHLAAAGSLAGIGGELGRQCRTGGRGEAGGLLQASDLSGALHVGQGLRFGGERNAVGKFAEEWIAGEVDVGELFGGTKRAAAAVGADEAAEVGDLVAVAQQRGVLGLGDDQGGDAFLRQGEEFPGLAHAVLVEVGP